MAFHLFQKLCLGLLRISSVILAVTSCTPLRVVTQHVATSETSVPTGNYVLDPHHWSIVFDVEHFHYSRFTMRFDHAQAELNWCDTATSSACVTTLSAVIDAASINTNVSQLDALLKDVGMLNTTHYPAITFHSAIPPLKNGQSLLSGALTICGIAKPVTLSVKFNGYGRNPLTQQPTLGFSAEGHFRRSAFGKMAWYPAVGDDIHVRIEGEFVKTT